MRKKLANLFLGLVFIVIGGCYILSITVFDHSSFSIFFRGWWTLFIIVPCIYNMIESNINIGNCIGLLIGVSLFIQFQNIWDWHYSMWKICFPVVLIIIGLGIIFGNRHHHHNCNNNCNTNCNSDSCSNNYQTNDNVSSATFSSSDKAFSSDGPKSADGIPTYNAVFGSNEPNYTGQYFRGAKLSCIFGGIELNLRNAIIDQNCFIDATTIFGGMDIFLPANVKVIVNGSPFLGGVDNKFVSSSDVNAPVVTVNFSCVLGGIDIK